ncbi:tail fiber domain-containing protein [Aquimarina sp. RZ0]|uniref:tail fiber domain-containing protein n=1 Tax=Aquimarina sp. RZ0 TaxID=2607730 RepID=UPI0011F17D87|nr:tail fiber domain-containing protein [Aquimarina sp. RZ0]KAA1247181.1 tail fiber domain-containing protein [Aquimarina sp. RZ0]
MKNLFFTLFFALVLSFTNDISAQIYTDSNGRVGIGTTSPGKKLDIEGGSLRVRFSNTSPYRRRAFDINTTAADPRLESERYIVFFNTPRASFIDIYAKTLYERSDKNDKENITEIDDSYINKLSKLNAVSYNWKKDASKKKEIGFLAQDVEKVFPELVRSVEGIEGKSISYSHMTPILVEALKEQQELIKSLQLKVTELEQKINNTNTNNPNNTSSSKLIRSYPNPTQGFSTIELYLDDTITDAKIVLIDNMGTTIDTYPVAKRGNVFLDINNQKLTPGIYFYSLLIDNKKIDSKKIIKK